MRHLMALVLLVVITPSRTVVADDLAVLEEETWRAAVATVSDCIVQIRLIGGLEQMDGVLMGRGPTTGLIVSEDGLIVSSAYQFAQKPSSILVFLPNGERLPAQRIATDHSRMIVLLKIDPNKPLPVPQQIRSPEENVQETNTRQTGNWESDQSVSIGQWAIAVGRTFDVGAPNVSVGIVSAVNRMQGRVIQTDAKISDANYGGPLIDIRGRILGLLVPMAPGHPSEVAGTEWYDSGIGFAVPITHIQAVLPKLQAGKDLYPGLLGVSFAKGAAYRTPPRMDVVHPMSPAKRAGLRPGDVITAVDGKAVMTVSQFQAAIGPSYAGEVVRLTIQRGEESIPANVELVAELPSSELHQFFFERFEEPDRVADFFFLALGFLSDLTLDRERTRVAD